MKAFKALIFSLCPRSWREGLTHFVLMLQFVSMLLIIPSETIIGGVLQKQVFFKNLQDSQKNTRAWVFI